MMSMYSNAVHCHGPDSPQAAEARGVYADEPGFAEMADALDRIKRNIGGSGVDYPPANP